MFRKPDNLETDIEDLFRVGLYVDAFNKAYVNELKGTMLTVADLGNQARIVERINQWLKMKGIALLTSDGFNHYRVAQALLPMLTPGALTPADIEPFETLFSRLNALLN